MRFILDASVAIKLYVPEPDSSAARAWLERDVELLVPDIFLVEVAQALLRHRREGRLALLDLHEAVIDLSGLVRTPLPSAALLSRSLEMAEQLAHRLHDCLYLALAERLGCPLLTADERLVRKVTGSHLTLSILSISDPPP